MGFLTRCKRPFLFAFLLQFCNMLFSFFLKTFLILFEKQQLFPDWGITFTEPYALEQHAQREVKYAGSKELRKKILKEYGIPPGQQIVPGQERFPERQKPGLMQENV